MPALFVTVLIALAMLNPGIAQGQGTDLSSAYFEAQSGASTLTALQDVNLETPQACVEHFVLAARQGKWRRAAAALDFRLHGTIDEKQAAEAAQHFFYVLNQELWIDWDKLPDRPDGVTAEPSLGAKDPMAGKIRRSIQLGTITAGDRSVPIQLDRMKTAEGDLIWLFSAQTVDNIDAFWELHGPSSLSRQMPSWARERGPMRVPIWQWIGLLLALLLCPVIGLVAGKGLCHWLSKRLPAQTGKLAHEIEWPVAGITTFLLLWLLLEWGLGLPSNVAAVLEPLTVILLVAMIVWLIMRTITFVIDRVVKQAIRDQQEEESVEQRRLLTKITVARHVLLLGAVLMGLALVLLHFDSLRTVGVTLLTSAGAMAVVLGIAGHAVLGNLIAGLQIAFGQPFRIGDTIHVEDNLCYIEDITYVDIIVRTWDQRRLVFPIGYFISNWFENWSMTDPYLIKAIYLEVDYRADVSRIRKKFTEIIHGDEDFASDRDEPEVLVTNSRKETLTLRLTCPGPTPSRAWALECRVREQLIAWLQDVEDGAYLPRRRVLVHPFDESGQETEVGDILKSKDTRMRDSEPHEDRKTASSGLDDDDTLSLAGTQTSA